MEYTAKASFVRVSPQKARLVLDLIKGCRVEDALNTLQFAKKAVAPAVRKVLQSALDNANYLSAEKNIDLDVDRLYVTRAIANEGPRMKRVRPAPQGRAYRIQRRISHIEVALSEKPGFAAKAVEEAPAAKAPAKKAAKKAPAKKAAAKKAPAKKSAAKKTAKKK